MDWIKKRYDQFTLALVAVALLAFAIIIYLKTGSFQEKFADAMATVPISRQIPKLELDQVERAKNNLAAPAHWEVPRDYEASQRGSLFVSQFYIVGPMGIPTKPINESLRKDTLTNESIPNRWFMENNLSPLEATAGLQDPDKDGFSNEDEWRAQTDPNNKESHPPYYTKLFFKNIIRIQFRLIFNAFNGDLKKPETWEFQINTLDLRQPSEFLKIGDSVPHTKFKLDKYEPKEVLNPNTNEMVDVSELTLVNIETQEPIVLIVAKVTNSPDVYALLDYEWPPAAGDIRVKKLQEFALRPDTDKTHLYRLVDVKDNEAVIQLPNGEKKTIVRDPRKGR